jgi:DNA helicase II / ATP-dependent DNA helicase PcrA
VTAGTRKPGIPEDSAPLSEEQPHAAAPPEIVRGMGGKGGRVPTLQQWRAISQPLAPFAVVAGAGSGKTAVMAARVVYLSLVATGGLPADNPGALPSQVLCLTFTNKAAEELARRVREATAGLDLPEGEEATVLTYHAFAARLLDDYGLRMGLEPGQRLLSDAQKWQLVVSLLEDRQFEHLEVRTLRSVIGDALALSDECANHLVDPDVVREESLAFAARVEIRRAEDRTARTRALQRAELAEVVMAYRERKRILGVIDYGDQIALAHRLVEDHPEVVQDFRARFPVVLLDEYQDTNVAQARLLRALCGPGYPVMAVGDPDQNIYAWRGASLSNLLRFPAEFGNGGAADQRPLYVNFRSGSRILAVADEVIGKVPEERRAPDKTLRPHPDRGAGRVRAFVASDERSEARRIAGLISDITAARDRTPEGEEPWGDFAVLCRKKRLFGAIAEVLREEGIPVEVVDLGGLLRLPEVVEVVAWLRLLADPSRNVSLARILQSPRWRIGHRDLVALARWSAERNRHLSIALPGEDVSPGDVSFSLMEAVTNVDRHEMTGLSEEARGRLAEFRACFERLEGAAQGVLADLVADVVEETGLMRELEASRSRAAPGAKRNLLNLVQHVSAFSPVEGEASLSTLIEYLDAAEETEDELEPVQVSEANTVKMLTIHKAKGLEWPVVFVPGLATGPRSSLFPDTSRQANPVTQSARLPFELRGDAEVLPRYEGNLEAFKAELRSRGEEEERRLCYVALTRARDELVLSGAHWYEGPAQPFEPSSFYEEIAAHPDCEVVAVEECPEANPLIALRGERAARWPGPGHRDDIDDLFPEGWIAAAEAAVRDASSVDERAERLAPGEQAAFRSRVEADLERATLIEERAGQAGSVPPPTSLSVSGLLDYLRCPKLFYWSHVRPLPRRPSPAARLGSDVHRWIELESRGQATLIDIDEFPDLSTEERLADPGHGASLKSAFKRSRFAEHVPLYVERPFLLWIDGMVVGGRIDAVFGEQDGPWEVVDYKTGRVPSEDDPMFGFQLDLYGLACVEIWGKRPEDLTLTYFYLAEDKEVSRAAGDPLKTRARVGEALAGIVSARYEPTPSDRCRWCDFLSFCDAGRAFVAQERPVEESGT